MSIPSHLFEFFLPFHAFQDGGPRMIWDSHSSHLEEPNVNEKEWAMGFHTNTTTTPDLLEGARGIY